MGALALILAVLGGGIGLSSVSPWPSDTEEASRISVVAIVWLILVQLIASSIGGYLAGRLRTKWVSLHNHEIYFRDTAHGFIAWAVALVISTLLFTSYAASIASRPMAAQNAPNNYFVDMLFRTDHPAATRTDQPLRSEATLILANGLRHPDIAKQDQAYLINLVAAVTGLNQTDAERRVTETITDERRNGGCGAQGNRTFSVLAVRRALDRRVLRQLRRHDWRPAAGYGFCAALIIDFEPRRATCAQSCCCCSASRFPSLS